MATVVTKAGPYFTTPGSEIKFSELRKQFRAQSEPGVTPQYPDDFNAISVSELIRKTDTTIANPIVPDCKENEDAGIVATESNWKTSHFRGSIKYYKVTQSGTNDNTSSLSSVGYNISAAGWNTNLERNIRKYTYLTGTIGSSNGSYAAAELYGVIYNMTVEVTGTIYGAAGIRGAAALSTISGTAGGHALSVTSTGNTNTNNTHIVDIILGSGAKVYGGGGGGERGSVGATGSQGTCYYSQSYTTGTSCGSCPGCNPGSASSYNEAGGNNCNCGKGGCGSKTCSTNCTYNVPYTVPGAPGGAGGDGANGRGYNNQTASLTGIEGAPGTTGGCPTYGGSGSKGETGGSGGDWGEAGGNTDNTGSGGGAGRAIAGGYYSVTGANSSTIQGFFTWP